MKIGLDIDNVITEFDGAMMRHMLDEDINKRGLGIVNPGALHPFGGQFDWSKEELDSFLNANMERFAAALLPKKDCKKYTDRLLSDGHELYLISHRAAPHYTDPWGTTESWLKRHNINYTRLIISNAPNKTEECKELKVDVMVDDRADMCAKMRDGGIHCILMRATHTRYDGFTPVAEDWEQCYRMLTDLAELIE